MIAPFAVPPITFPATAPALAPMMAPFSFLFNEAQAPEATSSITAVVRRWD
jgi:hypothetical protein